MNTALLFMCHSLDEATTTEFERLCCACSAFAVPYVLYHRSARDTLADGRTPRLYPFTDESITNLPYRRIRRTLVPGSVHFPLLQFFGDHPDYAHYWLIEYDVRFSGSWRSFFEFWSEDASDLLACHLRRYSEEPAWRWWPLRHPRLRIPPPERLRSFSPIYRISNAALAHLDHRQREGWCGHTEVVMPTLLFQGGFQLRDFGGQGGFVRSEDRGRFYAEGPNHPRGYLRQGTMRWRPAFSEAGSSADKLYHPVKPLASPAPLTRIGARAVTLLSNWTEKFMSHITRRTHERAHNI